MTPETERERLWAGWGALKAACRKQHPGGPGAAMTCICGAGCGGSAACTMLAVLRDFVRYCPAPGEPPPPGWPERLALLQAVIY